MNTRSRICTCLCGVLSQACFYNPTLSPSASTGESSASGSPTTGSEPGTSDTASTSGGTPTEATTVMVTTESSTDPGATTQGAPSECGNGVIEAPEECDEGAENLDTKSCTSICKNAVCGDGLLQTGVEACDDGNLSNDDECTDLCALASCGDGLVFDGAEECDDGNTEDFDECSNSCTIVVHRKVFLSSAGWSGNLGGLKGADEKCATAAKSAALTGAFIAWLSTDDSSNAALRIGTDFTGVYDLVDGQRVANGWAGLIDAPLLHAINLDETGNQMNNQSVWTNTEPNGTSAGAGPCSQWTSDAFGELKPFVGNSSGNDTTWTKNALQSCATVRRLYCFQVAP